MLVDSCGEMTILPLSFSFPFDPIQNLGSGFDGLMQCICQSRKKPGAYIITKRQKCPQIQKKTIFFQNHRKMENLYNGTLFLLNLLLLQSPHSTYIYVYIYPHGINSNKQTINQSNEKRSSYESFVAEKINLNSREREEITPEK